MPRLTPAIAHHFIGRCVRNRVTRNPALLIDVLHDGRRIRVRPNYHGGVVETCDTKDYDAFISRNPDLRHLFDVTELVSDPSDLEPETTQEPPAMQDPDVLIPASSPKQPDLLTQLSRIKEINSEIAHHESIIAALRNERDGLKKDAAALRSMLDDLLGVDTPPRSAPIPTTRTGSKQESRARAIVQWARARPDPKAPIITTDVSAAFVGHDVFKGVDNLAVAVRSVLESQPCFKKLGPSVYTLTEGAV